MGAAAGWVNGVLQECRVWGCLLNMILEICCILGAQVQDGGRKASEGVFFLCTTNYILQFIL